MPDEEGKVISDFLRIYDKYRGHEMVTDEDWINLAKEVTACAELHKWRECPLALHMMNMVMDTMNDLYKDGKKPVIADFIGRGDL